MQSEFSPLVVDQVANPAPWRKVQKARSQQTVYHLWCGNTTVALMNPTGSVIMLENHSGIAPHLVDYLFKFHTGNSTKFNLNDGKTFQYFIKSIRRK